jgi:hypothetical protein
MSKTEFEIEFEGIYNTIKAYTNDHYIIGYINGLKKALKSDDDCVLCLLLSKLIKWYEDNMQSILGSEYIYNKPQHIQTQKLLSDFLKSVQPNN